jgi:hypothetical protein
MLFLPLKEKFILQKWEVEKKDGTKGSEWCSGRISFLQKWYNSAESSPSQRAIIL